MPSPVQSPLQRSLPRLPGALLRRMLPRAERDELLADIAAEYARRAATNGRASARRWVWRQALASAPAFAGWSWWRGHSGFESRANAYRPGGSMLASWFADARYAARRLRARPGFTLLAVLTLALGIGGTAAVYGVARPLLIDPLPYANADEVATFWMGGSWTEQEFTFLRGRFPGFSAVATYRSGDATMRVGDAPARLLPGIAVSSELFDVLGARPLLGRTFQKGEDVPGAEPAVVISYGLWQELGGDRGIIGTRLTLDGTPRTVVGVMPRGFWFPDPATRIWQARQINPEGQNGSYNFIGRVAPGQDVRQMAPQLRRLTTMIGERFKYDAEWDKTKNAFVTPLRDDLLGSMRPALGATIAAMALILLIACANVAALMLGQVEGRASELAVRTALGATNRRLTQQLVIEAVLLGLGAALAGGALAAVGFRFLADALPIGAWRDGAAFDWTMFASALGVALIAVMLVVLVPLVSLWRGDLRGALSRARTAGVQGRGGRLERGLVVAEVALAMLIATGAALLVRSVANLYAIRPGLETNGLAVVDVVANSSMTPAERRQAMLELTQALGEMPGVRSASAVMKLPLRGRGDSFGMSIDGRPPLAEMSTYFRIVAVGYFETMGIRLRDGRTFNTGDTYTGELPILVNDALAKKYFPGESPLGRIVRGGYGVPQRIIGVVENVAEGSLTDEPYPARYFLGGTVSWMMPYSSFVIRTTRPEDAQTILDDARRTVNRVVPGFAIQGTTTMARVLDAAVGPARQVMSLLALLSGLALVLGAVGIYGVVSHFAARRKRDWAIRVVLGLAPWRVVTHIVRQGTTLIALGIVIGLIAATAMARLLASLLFGVGTIDFVAFAAASAALLVVGLLAAFLPARKAGRVDLAAVLGEQ